MQKTLCGTSLTELDHSLILMNLSLLVFKMRITTPTSLSFMRIRFDCVCELALETLQGKSGMMLKPRLVPGTY